MSEGIDLLNLALDGTQDAKTVCGLIDTLKSGLPSATPNFTQPDWDNVFFSVKNLVQYVQDQRKGAQPADLQAKEEAYLDALLSNSPREIVKNASLSPFPSLTELNSLIQDSRWSSKHNQQLKRLDDVVGGIMVKNGLVKGRPSSVHGNANGRKTEQTGGTEVQDVTDTVARMSEGLTTVEHQRQLFLDIWERDTRELQELHEWIQTSSPLTEKQALSEFVRCSECRQPIDNVARHFRVWHAESSNVPNRDMFDQVTPVTLVEHVTTWKQEQDFSDSPLDDQQISALHLYTLQTPIYQVINRSLRVNDQPVVQSWETYIKHLQKALKVQPAHVGAAYRGIDCKVDEQLYGIGSVVAWWSFSSASTNPQVAKDFLGAAAAKDPTAKPVGTLFVLSSLTGRPMSRVSAFPEEDEVLFPANSQFRVRTKMSSESKSVLASAVGVNLDNVTVYELVEVDLTSCAGLLDALYSAEKVAAHELCGLLQEYAEHGIALDEVSTRLVHTSLKACGQQPLVLDILISTGIDMSKAQDDKRGGVSPLVSLLLDQLTYNRNVIDTVNKLVRFNVDVNTPAVDVQSGKEITAIQVSAQRGEMEMTKLLLSLGCNITGVWWITDLLPSTCSIIQPSITNKQKHCAQYSLLTAALGDYPTADTIIQKADPKASWHNSFAQGWIQVLRGKYKDAIQSYTLSLNTLRDCKDHNQADIAELHVALADVCKRSGDAKAFHENITAAKKITNAHTAVFIRMLLKEAEVCVEEADFAGALSNNLRGFQIMLGLKNMPDAVKKYISFLLWLNAASTQIARAGYAEGTRCLAAAEKIAQDNFGTESPQILSVLEKYTELEISLGHFSAAVNHCTRMLQIAAKIYDTNHYEVGKAHMQLGNTYVAVGDYDEGHTEFEKAREIMCKVVGESHPDIAMLNKCVGECYRWQEEFTTAGEYFQKALAVYEDAFGEENIYYATVLDLIGYNQWKMKDAYTALETHKRTLKIRQKLLPPNHADIAETLHNLALAQKHAYRADNELTKERMHQLIDDYKHVLRLREACYGLIHPSAARACNNIANLYGSAGDKAEAREWHLKALHIKLAVWPDGHISVAESYRNYAIYCSDDMPEKKEAFISAYQHGVKAQNERYVKNLKHDLKRFGVDISKIPLLAEDGGTEKDGEEKGGK